MVDDISACFLGSIDLTIFLGGGTSKVHSDVFKCFPHLKTKVGSSGRHE